jgi:hypothetical protein
VLQGNSIFDEHNIALHALVVHSGMHAVSEGEKKSSSTLRGEIATIGNAWCGPVPDFAVSRLCIERRDETRRHTVTKPEDAITLRIYRMPSGQWAGRLFVGAEEVGSFEGYASTHAVEQAVRETGLYPEYIEFEGD